MGNAPQTQAAVGGVCARAGGGGGAAAQSVDGRTAAAFRSARSGCLYDWIRAAVCDLQASHAVVSRCRAAETAFEQFADAGADSDRGQSASEGSTRENADPRYRGALARSGD